MSKEEEIISLFEYLGHGAGMDLGRKVNNAAKKKKIPLNKKEIDHPGYKGKVMMYPKSFLDDYFGKTTTDKPDKHTDSWKDAEDDLPF